MDTVTTWSVDADDRSPHRYWSIYLHTPTGKHRLDVGPFHHDAEAHRWARTNLSGIPETTPTLYNVEARRCPPTSTAAVVLGVKWELHIQGVGVTQAEDDNEIEEMVRDYLDCMNGNPNADIVITWPSGPTITYRTPQDHD
jgi:hypothetical protein